MLIAALIAVAVIAFGAFLLNATKDKKSTGVGSGGRDDRGNIKEV